MDRNVEALMSLGIARVQERSAAAEDLLESHYLEALYDEHARALFGYALALSSSPEDAEDAVQEVFVALARQRGRLGRIDNMRAYLLKATRNATFTLLRARQRRGSLEQALAEDARDSDQGSRNGTDLEGAELRECFDLLPLDQREVLVLKVFQGLTFREIAQAVGISINTAASRYRYAIEKLRASLSNQHGADEESRAS